MYAKIKQPKGSSWIIVEADKIHYSSETFWIDEQELLKQKDAPDISNQPFPQSMYADFVPYSIYKEITWPHGVEMCEMGSKVNVLWYRDAIEAGVYEHTQATYPSNASNSEEGDKRTFRNVGFNYLITEDTKGNKEVYIFPTIAFIMNDDGKTIAKIGY